MWTADFDALGTSVRVEAPEELAAPLRAVLGTYAGSVEPPALDYLVERRGGESLLFRDSELVVTSPVALDMVPCLEGDLYAQVARRCTGWGLHAASVADESGAIVLAGASGAGKSTLSLALASEGFRYLSDERLSIAPDLGVRGLTRPVGIARDSRAPVPAGSFVAEYPSATPRPENPRLVHLPPGLLAHTVAPLRLLVCLRHDPSAVPGIRRLTPGEALSLLWAETVRGGRDAWDIALRAVRQVPAAELVTREIAPACGHLQDLLRAL